AIAISACFGSVSVMTYIAAGNFLEKLDIQYDSVATTALALMEIPAIISGLFIAKKVSDDTSVSTKKILFDTIFNKSILTIFAGLIFGIICSLFNWDQIPKTILLGFKPFLALFLFYMGWIIGKKKKDLGQFSWSLILFGFYMPLLGAFFGILLSFFLNLDVGTGTMVAILSASASYIAAPAAMKIAVPQANETIYLPLSLAIAFPFNVVIGIPLYYQLSLLMLKNH
ncbi:MAG: sodium-dependent bicarbonate transport family permease, partial [Chlamydiae bacterium]|nr:sodium-dependent bicarbonate transport family permease [Chlamydiota bacterium]